MRGSNDFFQMHCTLEYCCLTDFYPKYCIFVFKVITRGVILIGKIRGSRGEFVGRSNTEPVIKKV